jgi:hypothetical protein
VRTIRCQTRGRFFLGFRDAARRNASARLKAWSCLEYQANKFIKRSLRQCLHLKPHKDRSAKRDVRTHMNWSLLVITFAGVVVFA